MYQHTFSASVSEEGQGFLGFIPALQVVDCHSLHALLRQLYNDRTAESTRASSDECSAERYFHAVDRRIVQAATGQSCPTAVDFAIPGGLSLTSEARDPGTIAKCCGAEHNYT